METYNGDFKNWGDVAQEFTNRSWSDSDDVTRLKALAVIPEPEQVLYAEYKQEGYEGSAWVVYRNGDKFYSVEGSHCSCYGLEDQWKPEEYDRETFLGVMNRKLEEASKPDAYNYALDDNVEALKHVIEQAA